MTLLQQTASYYVLRSVLSLSSMEGEGRCSGVRKVLPQAPQMYVMQPQERDCVMHFYGEPEYITCGDVVVSRCVHCIVLCCVDHLIKEVYCLPVHLVVWLIALLYCGNKQTKTCVTPKKKPEAEINLSVLLFFHNLLFVSPL